MKPLHIILAILVILVGAGVIITTSFQKFDPVLMTEAGPARFTLEDKIIRSYQVDARYRDEVHGTLDGLLRSHKLGSVEALPNGMLAVMAPFRQHQEIEALIAGINQSKPEPAASIQLDYWIVEGTPGGTDADDYAIDKLLPVLDELQQTHGPMGFSILESATINSQAGNMSILQGSKLSIHQRATTDGSSLNGFVRLKYRGDDAQSLSMDLNFSARPGEFMVLGTNTVMEKLYFYIVRWPGLLTDRVAGEQEPRQSIIDMQADKRRANAQQQDVVDEQ